MSRRKPDTILVVDDSALARKAIARVLQKGGYAVLQAANGAEALRLAAGARPRLVLLDAVLPDISGTEVLRRLRANPALEGLAVLFLSAQRKGARDRVSGLDAGADDSIARPVPNAELLARVRAQLRQQELNDALRKSEAAQRALNRRLRMLSHCSAALVRATAEQELLDAICGIIVREGGYRIAVVIYAERNGARRVRLAGYAGADRGYLESLRVNWRDDAHGRGPTGTAIRTGQAVVVGDIATDARLAPWREGSLTLDNRSMVSLPLKHGEEIFGALTITAREAGAFDVEEVALLSELAGHLAFGIAALRVATEQRVLVQGASVGIAIVRERRIARCNPEFARMYGYEPDELTGASTRPLFADDGAFEVFGREAYGAVAELGSYRGDLLCRKADGSLFWVHLGLTPLDLRDPGRGVVAVAQDIDERKRAEERVRALNRSLRVINLCNDALVRVASEAELLHEICGILVGAGGYRSAWIGFAEHDEAKSVSVAEAAGENREFFERQRFTWAEGERGGSAVGTAIRTGEAVMVNDICNDPRTVPWREVACANRHASVVALPIKRTAAAAGVLTIYSEKVGAFTEDELQLLAELAANLSYGLGALRTDAEQRALVDNASVGIAFLRERRVMRCNRAFARLFGLEVPALLGQTTRATFPGDEEYEAFGRGAYGVLALGEVYAADSLRRRADGTTFWVNVTMVAIDPGDLSKGVISVLQDVDRNKRAELALLESERRLRRLNRLHAVMSETSGAVARATDRAELFGMFCRIAVEQGGLRMAWVGLLDGETGEIVPAASHGAGAAAWFARALPFGGLREARFPVEFAVLENRPFISNDLRAEPRLAPVSDLLGAAGFRACASLPLSIGGRVAGGFTLFAADADWFDADMAGLVHRMAADLSFALENFDREAARAAAERELRAERDLSEALVRALPEIFYLFDDGGRFLRWNDAFETVTGYGAAELAAMQPTDLFAGDEKDYIAGRIAQVFASGASDAEAHLVTKDGRRLPFYFTGRRTAVRGRPCVIGVGMDLSQRRRDERRLRALNRSLQMLGRCNEALVRAKDETQLLDEICRIVVEVGGYRMAWVGFAEHDAAKSVRPAAWAGIDDGFIAALRVTWADTERGRGSAGTAVRTGAPAVVGDIATDPRTAPWREMALARGFAGVAGFPLRHDGAVFGVLCACAPEPDAFGAEEVALLSDLASDLAYGIMALRTAREQQALLAGASVGIAFIRERRIVRCNPAFARLFGYDPAQLLGESTRQLFPAKEIYEAYGGDAYATALQGGVHAGDLLLRRADGADFWCHATIAAVQPGDAAKGFVAVVQDIDRRKRAEKALRESEAELSLVADNVPAMIAHMDRGLRFTYVNRQYLEYFGASRDTLIGQPLSAIVGEAAWAQIRAHFERALAGERVGYQREVRRTGCDLSYISAELVPHRDATGAVAGLYGMIRDVTLRMKSELALREKAAQLRELMRRLVETEEAERRRLARELHDRMGQNVNLLKLNLNLLRGELPAEAAAGVAGRLEDCGGLLDDTGRLVRDLMNDLRPAGLDDLGLCAALREHARQFARRSGLPVEVQGAEFAPRLAPEVELAFFRIVQEAFANAAGHARATAVTVSLGARDGRALLTIADNGSGFDAEARPPVGHLGLVGMRERAEAVGASLRIESAPDAGTRIIVEVLRNP